MTYTADLCRTFKNDKQTLGQIDVVDSDHLVFFTCFSLELPDLNNEVRKSCIPDGTYKLTLENHPKFGWCYRVHDVPGRTGVLIHAGTNFTHTLGCVLPSMDQKDLNADGELDNISSKKALSELVKFDLKSIRIYSI